MFLGPEHPHTLISRNNLANALDAQGKHAESEGEHRAVLKIRERVLGPEHPDSLQSLYNLAVCFLEQGKAKEARTFAERAADGARKILGSSHPHTKDYERLLKHLTDSK